MVTTPGLARSKRDPKYRDQVRAGLIEDAEVLAELKAEEEAAKKKPAAKAAPAPSTEPAPQS